MALTCEVCGSPLRGPPNSIEIDGAVLQVCQNCSKLGKPIIIAPRGRTMPPHLGPPHAAAPRSVEPEMEVDPDYAGLVRNGREKLGLTQEALGRMLNVKPSVISHIETGKMKPDLGLARSLMHLLKVNLLVPSSELDANAK